MEEMLVQNETLSLTEQNLLAYFETHDVKYVTEDASFKNLSTGEVHKGREDIGAMLHYMYHVAFDAKAEMQNYFFTENKAVVEGLFKGRHIGELAGIAQMRSGNPLTVFVRSNRSRSQWAPSLGPGIGNDRASMASGHRTAEHG